MNLGGIGKSATEFAQKTAKAQKVKSVKLKIKFGDGKNGRVPGLRPEQPAKNQRN